jgi:hypothetical protein
MAHYAKISEENKVLQVLTLDNSNALNTEGQEDEAIGQVYLEKHNNWPAHLWIKTSYNTIGNIHVKGGTPFRGNYAGIGFEWDKNNQIFWPKKPFTSWIKHNNSASWKSPIGDEPALTAEQTSQNEAGTHNWEYFWDEAAYQVDNTTGWVLTDYMA